MRTFTKKDAAPKGDVEDALGSMKDTDSPSANGKPAKEPAKKRAPARGSLERRLLETFQAFGGALILKGDLPCGRALTAQAPALAEAFDHLAQENPFVRKFLESMSTGGAITEIMMAAMPVMMVAGAHHGSDPRKAVAMGLVSDDGIVDWRPISKPKEQDFGGKPETVDGKIGNVGDVESSIPDLIPSA